ncbi:MarR family transcriptional regulator [Carbonactinospora thermoautotrophica]|uniref:MarR family winged helix-turn-helix transcriptional regulator n=1 Tax=Carbonactinospora thermoautotrophica TaxID=1469144 RepID=UPI0022712146|nr:MarR family winged helix-turn-helix transcriptional regulator [Carbonactinospora thermoautotrophica]MCX9192860.1 MarR family transcriptional regulator [Carbonactinospora thermoautotrophica]
MEPLERRLAVGLAKLATAMRAQEWERAGRHRLTPTQAQLLLLLAERRDGYRVAELAEELSVTRQTVSDSAATLVRKGLAEKHPVEGDRRGARLTPTPAGHEEAARLAGWPDAMRTVLGELAPDEQETLLRITVKMIRSMQERGQMPVARVCVTCQFFEPNAHPGTPTPHHCRFVDAAFGDAQLQIDCGDHRAAPADRQAELWRRFTATA